MVGMLGTKTPDLGQCSNFKGCLYNLRVQNQNIGARSLLGPNINTLVPRGPEYKTEHDYLCDIYS